MGPEPRANCIAGEWRAAVRGARFVRESIAGTTSWPQSGAEDVAAAAESARAACAEWSRTPPAERVRLADAMARRLESDGILADALRRRFDLSDEEVAPHVSGLERSVEGELERPPRDEAGLAWLAPDWSELVRGPMCELARGLQRGRAVVLVSDARLPELCERIAVAACEAGAPPGVVGLLHGATRELVTLCLADPRRGPCTLIASGTAQRMVELRRACERAGVADPRLRALRCGVHELETEHTLEDSARAVVELAFGRGTTFGGQLPGSLGRVFCPARHFSRFTELCLVELEASPASSAPVPLIDDDAVARLRVAWELGLDEGATCIAGGGEGGDEANLPTILTNVEVYMASARRQDPLPVLCLLRSS